MKIKNFSIAIFIISTIAFIGIVILSFVAAWAEDEGTLGNNVIWIAFAKLFYIFRFPTHVLAWPAVSHNSEMFFGGLFFNCMFYGLITERLIYIFKNQK